MRKRGKFRTKNQTFTNHERKTSVPQSKTSEHFALKTFLRLRSYADSNIFKLMLNYSHLFDKT